MQESVAIQVHKVSLTVLEEGMDGVGALMVVCDGEQHAWIRLRGQCLPSRGRHLV